MNGTEEVAWLTIRLREPDSAQLAATLTEIVKRAHTCGLRAATIFHAPGDVSIPHQIRPNIGRGSHDGDERPVISLPDNAGSGHSTGGVGGTVTIADDAERLRGFVAVLGDLVPADAVVRLDAHHDVYDLTREPVDR